MRKPNGMGDLEKILQCVCLNIDMLLSFEKAGRFFLRCFFFFENWAVDASAAAFRCTRRIPFKVKRRMIGDWNQKVALTLIGV